MLTLERFLHGAVLYTREMKWLAPAWLVMHANQVSGELAIYSYIAI